MVTFYIPIHESLYVNCTVFQAIGSHNLVFGMPEGCNRSSCEYYVGLSRNPSNPTYLDVYLEGNAAGWVAIGFSLNTQMVY